MAARRVSLRYLLVAMGLSVSAAAATFELKYTVRDLDRELETVRTRIVQEHWALQSARAELEFLTRPERLVMQVAQLGMVPARGARLVQVGQIVPWSQLQFASTPLLVSLPSGAEVPLRVRPMPAMTLIGLEDD